MVLYFQKKQGNKRNNNGKIVSTISKLSGKGIDSLGARVVITAAQELALDGDNHILAFDNYFSSPALLEYLLDRNIFAISTVRANRVGLPKDLPVKMARGELDYRVSSTDLLFVKWFDNRPVHFLSNFHGNDTCFVERTKHDGSKVQVPALSLVADYNRLMGGVDKADMLRALYELDRKSKKFWHRYFQYHLNNNLIFIFFSIFFALLEVALVNSFVTYNEFTMQKIPFIEFKTKVVDGLLQLSKRKQGRPSSKPLQVTQVIPRACKRQFTASDDCRLNNVGIHWPCKQFDSDNKALRGRCEWCSVKHDIEKRTTWKCESCDAFLCLEGERNCFKLYHFYE